MQLKIHEHPYIRKTKYLESYKKNMRNYLNRRAGKLA